MCMLPAKIFHAVPRATRHPHKTRARGRPSSRLLTPSIRPPCVARHRTNSRGSVHGACTSSRHKPHTQTPTPHTTTMAAAVADSLPPTTYGCSPALLLNSATSSSSTTARSSVASALAVGTGGAGASDAAGGELLPVSNVHVHPLVLLSVLDHHTRRQEGAGRVIGTLLGKRDGGQVR